MKVDIPLLIAVPSFPSLITEYRNWVPQIDDLPQVVKKADTQPSTNSSTHNPTSQDQVKLNFINHSRLTVITTYCVKLKGTLQFLLLTNLLAV